MRLHRILPICAGVALMVCQMTAHVSAQSTSTAASTRAMISNYYSHINVDFQSGDFSDLAMFYAPNAVFTNSNPTGVTTLYRGLPAIIGFYKGVYAKLPSLHFAMTSERSLGPAILLVYEHGRTPTMPNGPRCTHLFVVSNGLIQTDDWIGYFAGKLG